MPIQSIHNISSINIMHVYNVISILLQCSLITSLLFTIFSSPLINPHSIIIITISLSSHSVDNKSSFDHYQSNITILSHCRFISSFSSKYHHSPIAQPHYITFHLFISLSHYMDQFFSSQFHLSHFAPSFYIYKYHHSFILQPCVVSSNINNFITSTEP